MKAKFYAEKKLLLKKKIFQKKNYVNNISFEKYIFMQKIYVLQAKRYYDFNYIIILQEISI